MFEKFGEFDSAKEINRAAEAQKREGDTEAVLVIAEENGIDREDVEDFLDGIVPELASPLMAAMGKLQVEEADLKPEGIMKDWLSYIRIQCTEDEGMAKAVRRKGKSLKKCIGVLLKWSFENAREINKEVAGYAGIPKNVRVTLGIPDMGTAKRLIMEYYGS